MTKKKSTRKKKPKTHEMRRMLLRVPTDVAEWIDEAAAEASLSRDAFMRQLLIGAMEGFAAAETEDLSLFRRMEERIEEAAERALRDVLEASIAPKDAGKIAAEKKKR